MIWKPHCNNLQIYDISCNLDYSKCRCLYNICIISSIFTSYLTISQPILHLCPHNTTTIILWQTSTIKNSRNTSGSWWISPGKEWGMWVSAMWLWMSAVMRWGPRRGSARSWPLSVWRRHAAVCAGLDDWPMTGLKFHNTSLQLALPYVYRQARGTWVVTVLLRKHRQPGAILFLKTDELRMAYI